MKWRAGWMLVGSHLLLGWIGWLVADSGGRSAAEARELPAFTRSAPVALVPEHADNPIFRASGADFRAAWMEILRRERSASGEPGGLSLNFFLDWCGVDPEGAVLGLRDLYAPRFSHNYLGNATSAYGAELAAPLVEHWQDLHFERNDKLAAYLTRSLNALAGEDPAEAARLVTLLAPEMRDGMFSWLFRGLPGDRLEEFAGHLERGFLPGAGAVEQVKFWTELAKAVGRTEPSGGVCDWLGRISSRGGVEAFTREGVQSAVKFEQWPRLFEGIDALDGEQRQWAKDAVVKRVGSFYQYQGNLVPFLEACRHGDEWQWAEEVFRANSTGTVAAGEGPEAYLEWTHGLPDEASDPRRVGVGYALLADPAEALHWAESAAADRSRDLIAVQAIEELARQPDQGAAIRSWFVLIRDTTLQASARQHLREE